MTLDEIRKNAPDGATHYAKMRNKNVLYFIKSRNLVYIKNMWKETDYPINDIHNIKPL